MAEVFSTVSIDVDTRGIATVRPAREEVLNAFDETMIAELTLVYEGLDMRNDVRVVVLRSQGRAFCAGADL
ncbi:Enoyl-CoA hydratase/isomerase (fragment) [Paraburkholderia ribeironis]|uniref:Enoyl-CoA hydratase/isomerase n=1 Tax=Paraburkholderia ribeironis TaxID=1247936 RepID=A0A1N7S7T0_9BURK